MFETYFDGHEEGCEDNFFSRDALYRYAGYVLNLKRKKDKNGQERPLAENTKNQCLGCAKGFLSWAFREEKIPEDFSGVFNRRMKTVRTLQNVLSETQVEKILSAPETRRFLGYRDRVMLEVLYGTGMRRSELISLEVFDFHPGRGQMFIRQGKGKKDRYVPVPEYLGKYLESYLSHVRPRLVRNHPEENKMFVSSWGKKFSQDGLSSWAERIRRESGLPFTCHGFRHSFATHLLKHGAGMVYIQKLLGHEKIATTEVYTRVYPVELEKIITEKHPRNRDGSAVEEVVLPGKNWKLAPLPGGWKSYRKGHSQGASGIIKKDGKTHLS